MRQFFETIGPFWFWASIAVSLGIVAIALIRSVGAQSDTARDLFDHHVDRDPGL